MSNSLLKVGITIGDINGIGPEIIIRTLQDARLFKYFTPIVYGSSRVLSYYKNVLNMDELSYKVLPASGPPLKDTINVVNAWQGDSKISLGRATKDSGKYAYLALEAATQALQKGEIDVLVTAPLDKQAVNQSHDKFQGHTEYLQHMLKATDSLMLLTSDSVKVALATNHLPVRRVHEKLNKDIIVKKIMLLHESLRKDFLIEKPTIAVLSLNPHAGDNGLIGDEESTTIIPAIETLHNQNMLCFGPFSPDGFWSTHAYSKYDAVFCMYHDQGLIPFKMLAFDQGINFTAGLSAIRTSPDHGPAFDIVGKNQASPESFRNAIFTAIDLYRNRKIFEENHANPLIKKKLITEKS